MIDTKRTTLEPDLHVEVHAHDLTVGDVVYPVWTLLTEGLALHGQQEVMFVIVRAGAAAEDFPPGVLAYVPALKQFAQQGRVVRDGGISGYRAPGPFRLGRFVGVAFVDRTSVTGMDVPEDTLVGIFLTEGELAMASRCGVRRVLYRLGRQATYFPVPFWSDPGRLSVYAVDDAEESILSKMAHAAAPGSYATLADDHMRVRLPPQFARMLADQLEANRPSALIPDREPTVEAALVWSPDQTEAEGIAAEGCDGSEIAAAFVAFVPNASPEDEIRFIEDGYGVVLSEGSTATLVEALRSSRPVRFGRGARTVEITVESALH